MLSFMNQSGVTMWLRAQWFQPSWASKRTLSLPQRSSITAASCSDSVQGTTASAFPTCTRVGGKSPVM